MSCGLLDARGTGKESKLQLTPCSTPCIKLFCLMWSPLTPWLVSIQTLHKTSVWIITTVVTIKSFWTELAKYAIIAICNKYAQTPKNIQTFLAHQCSSKRVGLQTKRFHSSLPQQHHPPISSTKEKGTSTSVTKARFRAFDNGLEGDYPEWATLDVSVFFQENAARDMRFCGHKKTKAGKNGSATHKKKQLMTTCNNWEMLSFLIQKTTVT